MFGNEPKIEFVSTVPGLEAIEECRPVQAQKAAPDWWRRMPKVDGETGQTTVKKCPGMVDHFTNGYVIPMWADVRLTYSRRLDTWSVESGSGPSRFFWDVHGNGQFRNHARAQYLGRELSFVFKAISPWNIITPRGWSVYQMPMFYHYDNDFAVMPGVIDTDVHHVINQQVMYFGDEDEVVIKQGTPFVQYVPFKRQKIKSEIRMATKKDAHKFQVNNLRFETKHLPEGVYRKEQARRDSEGKV